MATDQVPDTPECSRNTSLPGMEDDVMWPSKGLSLINGQRKWFLVESQASFFFFFFSSQQTPNRNLWLVMDVRSESGEEGAVRGEGSHQS